MKNYLVGALRPILNKWGPWKGSGENPDWQKDLENYAEMYLISRDSARRHLLGNWEEIAFTSPVLDVRLFCIAQWYAIKELWHSEPCNILWMGSDTMFIQDSEIFGAFDDMRLFNYTEPRRILDIDHYFNDDVRYYSATMDPKVWEVGERHLSRWWGDDEYVKWDLGQMIHNYQFWSQEPDLSDIVIPQLNWLASSIRSDDPTQIAEMEKWNRCAIDDAHIIHFHGSRGSANTLTTMQEFSRKFSEKT